MKDDDFITYDILERLGFTEEGKDVLDRPIYRIKPPKDEKLGYYGYDIQIIISHQYTEDNPNSGIVSIFSPKTKAGAIPPDLSGKENWSDEDIERAKNYTVTIPEYTQSIAWYVTRVGRLKMIYHGLVGFELKERIKNIMGQVDERDWTEDFSHENGNYMCSCIDCKNMFFGHKRRTFCKLCAERGTTNIVIVDNIPPSSL